MRQYIESIHCNGEVKEKIWKILDCTLLQDVILYAKKEMPVDIIEHGGLKKTGKL